MPRSWLYIKRTTSGFQEFKVEDSLGYNSKLARTMKDSEKKQGNSVFDKRFWEKEIARRNDFLLDSQWGLYNVVDGMVMDPGVVLCYMRWPFIGPFISIVFCFFFVSERNGCKWGSKKRMPLWGLSVRDRFKDVTSISFEKDCFSFLLIF